MSIKFHKFKRQSKLQHQVAHHQVGRPLSFPAAGLEAALFRHCDIVGTKTV